MTSWHRASLSTSAANRSVHAGPGAARRGPLHVDDVILHTMRRPRLYPQRIINGEPAHYNSPQILVGGDETYEPRCEEHFVLPGRPMPGHRQASTQRRIWPEAAERE